MCSARELKGRAAAPLPLGGGRESTQGCEIGEESGFKQQNGGTVTSQKRESSCVWGKEWNLGLCCCTCSLCSPGWEHGWLLLQQTVEGACPWTSWVGVSTRVLPELSSPHGSPGRRGESHWAPLSVPTCCWQHQLVALPLATLLMAVWLF